MTKAKIPRTVWTLGFARADSGYGIDENHAWKLSWHILDRGYTRIFAGITWEQYGPNTTFLTGAGFAAGALVLFTLMHTRMRVD